MKFIINSDKAKEVSKMINRHCKNLKHQPLIINLNEENGEVELIMESQESRLRIDFEIETSKLL